MKLTGKMIKNVLVVGILLPGSALAASTTFYILNSGDSVVNPITITEAYLNYAGNTPNNPMCSGSVPLNQVLGWDNPTVKTGQQLSVVFQPVLDSSCFSDQGPEQFTLQIKIVDNKNIDRSCEISGPYLTSQDDQASGYSIRVTETGNHFFCDYPIGVAGKQ